MIEISGDRGFVLVMLAGRGDFGGGMFRGSVLGVCLGGRVMVGGGRL